jgi:hypothetical protein
MLTDADIKEMAPKMGVDIAYIGFKDGIPKRLRANKSYIINLDNALDTEGKKNGGTHWVCFFVRTYPNEKAEAIYFDSYGFPPPEIVKKRVRDNFGISLPHTKVDIQSLASDMCGWYCLAFLHFIDASEYRSRSLYDDVATFMEMFLDLSTHIDYKHNEWVLKHFFRSADPSLRTPVDVRGKETEETKEYEGAPMGIPVEVKYV